MQRTLLCFGLGYTAERLVRRLLGAGWRGRGTARDPARLEALARLGVEALPFERGRPLPGAAFEGVTHVLSSVPPDDDGDPVFDEHEADLRRVPWLGYLSSTAVYGDQRGAWVDASTPDALLPPPGPRGRARLRAETDWRALGAHVFRLAGLYGPGRSALDAVRAGRARRLDKPGHVFSRVHVDDVVTALIAALDRPAPGGTWDLADEAPSPHAEVVAYACELLGVPPPPLEPWTEAAPTLSPGLREFYAECRRVSGARTRAALGVALAYPDHRAGLRAVLEAEGREGPPR